MSLEFPNGLTHAQRPAPSLLWRCVLGSASIACRLAPAPPRASILHPAGRLSSLNGLAHPLSCRWMVRVCGGQHQLFAPQLTEAQRCESPSLGENLPRVPCVGAAPQTSRCADVAILVSTRYITYPRSHRIRLQRTPPRRRNTWAALLPACTSRPQHGVPLSLQLA